MRHARTILMLSVLIGSVPRAFAQESPEAVPKVIQHAEPTYPPLARQTRIDGEVRVKFTTDGESVLDVATESGHPLLRTASEDNVRTWKFVNHTPGTFHATFRYKFATATTEVTFLESPAIVRVDASTPMIGGIVWGWLDLGRWKAQLNSAHGKKWRVFTLPYSGPDEERLSGLRNSYKQSVYIPTTVGFSVTAPAESSFIRSVRKKGNHVAQTHSLSHAMHQLREAIW